MAPEQGEGGLASAKINVMNLDSGPFSMLCEILVYIGIPASFAER